jgi:hypothetical protein
MPDPKRPPGDRARLEPHPLVDALAGDPSRPPRKVIKLFGLPGRSTSDELTRLWLDADLASHVDIPNEAIVHSQTLPDDGGTVVWVAADAKLSYSTSSDVQADFLGGSIYSNFAGQAPSAGLGPDFGGTETLGFGGGFETMGFGCTIGGGSVTFTCPTLFGCPPPTFAFTCPSRLQCPPQPSFLIRCPPPPTTFCPTRLICPPPPSVLVCPTQTCPTRFCPSVLTPCQSIPACPSAICPNSLACRPGGDPFGAQF